MNQVKQVNILISCPGDVTPEKEIVIELCKTFTAANFNGSNICFNPLDWRDYVGHYGERPQEQLKNFFGIYDHYIGIWY